jgi:type I restriction enzyme S subunit
MIELGVLKTSCVYHGQFDATENKAVVPEEFARVACPVTAGTLIVSRMNTPDLVGAAGLVRQSFENLFLPDRLWQVHFSHAEAAYVHYWSRTPNYRAQVESACAGTSSSMQNLSQDACGNFVLTLPPLPEQTAIATFLDRETAKIDGLIAEQEKLIALLAEKRQATISHAVTKGLNPAAPMNDSGVAWLGKVPAHWQISRLKQIVEPGFSVSYGIVQPGEPLDDGVPFVQTTNMSKATFDLDQLQNTTAEIAGAYPRSKLSGGEVILGIRASIGAAYVVPEHLKGANLSRGVARIVCCAEISSEYLGCVDNQTSQIRAAAIEMNASNRTSSLS